ncbi:perlucin [Zeugodacus cucurbitae]|uniref:perlucin n=1 Tax=Zeugodacus cucurbitae TaxID=28588 RepID=UPI0023D9339D|nr:perlucin [Zeugodacus cucurbitae]
MFKYILALFFLCFVAQNLVAENSTADPYSGFVFPNLSTEALDKSNYRAFPGLLRDKTFVVVAYIKANWFKAQEICGYQGLSLGSINSKSENDLLEKYLLNSGLASNNEEFWLSGSKLADNSRWVWFNLGRPISYNRWAAGKPIEVLRNRNCLALLANGQWSNDRCEAEKYVICETRCPLTSYDTPIFLQK